MGVALLGGGVYRRTFRSGPVPVDRVDPLPLMVLRFNLVLDDRNRAPAGAAFDLPMWVEGQQTSTVPAVVRVSLAVSYDDGAHWQDAVLTPTRSGWVASLTHPAAGSGTGYVSLHATAADGTGGSVTQTIIHAYGLASTRDSDRHAKSWSAATLTSADGFTVGFVEEDHQWIAADGTGRTRRKIVGLE